jgi:hypothetical protein
VFNGACPPTQSPPEKFLTGSFLLLNKALHKSDRLPKN